MDSVVNNATAHYLHNMFFVLGSSLNRSAAPIKVTAELYRANAIENFDTVAALIKTSEGADIYYYASHAVSESYGPVFEYTFQKGVISYCGGEGTQAGITAVFQDGSTKDYGDPNEETLNKLWVTVEAVRGENTIRCPIEAAFSHTLCIDGMHRSATVSNFPDTYKRLDSEREIVWVEELSQVLHQCYNNYKLPAELDVPWAIPGNTVEIEAAGKES